MTREPTPDEVRELLGAYALDAVDRDERSQVEALLLSDAAARSELHELQQGAAWLGHASLRPPSRVWDTIAAEVGRDPQSESPTEIAEPPHVKTARRSEPGRTGRLLAAAAAAVLVIGGAAMLTLGDGPSSSDSVAARYEAARRDPSTREVALRSADGRYSARAAVLDDRTGYLAVGALPEPAPGRELQLWTITPDGPVSAGLLRGSAPIRQFRVPDAATALAVTEEPRGGSRSPTGAPIVSGTLTRV